MKNTFGKYPRLKPFLELFVKRTRELFSNSSVILFGGITYDDFSLKYSDIDLVVITKKGISNRERKQTIELIEKLNAQQPNLTKILYTYYMPKSMVLDPTKVFKNTKGLIIGNNKSRPITKYPLSILDNYNIKQKGVVLEGDRNSITNFPKPPENLFWKMFEDSIDYIHKAAELHPFQFTEPKSDNYIMNWLLYFPRLLYSLEEKDVIGKSKGAYWLKERCNDQCGDFIANIGEIREKNLSLQLIEDLVQNSRELLIYTLKQIFNLKQLDKSKFNQFKNLKTKNQIDFSCLFEELKENM